MFGSVSKGKSGTSSTQEKEDITACEGARPKEDHGVVVPDPWNDDVKGHIPPRSPSDLHNRECHTLPFGVEAVPVMQEGVGSYMLPAYVWTEQILWDIMSPSIEHISQIVVLNPILTDMLIMNASMSK